MFAYMHTLILTMTYFSTEYHARLIHDYISFHLHIDIAHVCPVNVSDHYSVNDWTSLHACILVFMIHTVNRIIICTIYLYLIKFTSVNDVHYSHDHITKSITCLIKIELSGDSLCVPHQYLEACHLIVHKLPMLDSTQCNTPNARRITLHNYFTYFMVCGGNIYHLTLHLDNAITGGITLHSFIMFHISCKCQSILLTSIIIPVLRHSSIVFLQYSMSNQRTKWLLPYPRVDLYLTPPLTITSRLQTTTHW